MEPGRELDALIAEKVFGINVVKSERKDGYTYYTDGEPNWDYWVRFEGSTLLNAIPFYSEELPAAWEIATEIPLDRIQIDFNHPYVEAITVTLTNVTGVYEGHGDTVPHALCLAALKLVENT